MTNEEAIAELKRDIELENDFTEDYISAVNMAIKALEEVGCEDYINRKVALDDYIRKRDCFKAWHWIPVSERLPEDNELVLFSTKTDRVFDGRFFSDNTNRQWYSFCDRTFAWNNVVIAWMPLPEPYKAESEVDNAK